MTKELMSVEADVTLCRDFQRQRHRQILTKLCKIKPVAAPLASVLAERQQITIRSRHPT